MAFLKEKKRILLCSKNFHKFMTAFQNALIRKYERNTLLFVPLNFFKTLSTTYVTFYQTILNCHLQSRP